MKIKLYTLFGLLLILSVNSSTPSSQAAAASSSSVVKNNAAIGSSSSTQAGRLQQVSNTEIKQPEASHVRKAIAEGDHERVKELLDAGATNDFSLLDLAVKLEQAEVATTLLTHSSNKISRSDITNLLPIAVRENDPAMVRALIIAGKANEKASYPDKRTLLHVAARCYVSQTVDYNSSAIGQAHYSGSVMKALIPFAVGIGVNAQDNKYGDTALHVAVENGNIEAIKELITVPGIDITLENKSGRTPYDMALGRNALEVKNILMKPLNLRKLNEELEAQMKMLDVRKEMFNQELELKILDLKK